jgi:hypothetical protein
MAALDDNPKTQKELLAILSNTTLCTRNSGISPEIRTKPAESLQGYSMPDAGDGIGRQTRSCEPMWARGALSGW